eukprot:12893742-Prorocentrum_lima.AAC.1
MEEGCRRGGACPYEHPKYPQGRCFVCESTQQLRTDSTRPRLDHAKPWTSKEPPRPWNPSVSNTGKRVCGKEP